MHNFQNVRKEGLVKARLHTNCQIAAVDLNIVVVTIFLDHSYIGPLLFFILLGFPVYPGGPTAVLGVFNAF